MDMEAADKKLGPLPVWGWGLILGIAAVAWVWWGQANKATTAAATAPRTTGAADSTALDSLYGPYAGKTVVLEGVEFRLLREGQIEGYIRKSQ